ncbi:hypothetical protein [Streptomyces hainanensis]|uniref:Uncharacterized protein n=1 Tax=Streptomyces hainanensis TaxID=402648 RepID=A0A4R4TCM4_9ACTN|nr:hypothetical protein [Streptomyces hainanensis]TDC73294.1 hypothetical protein E1283_19555 [Streptomyces hainanensis]
MARSDTTPPTRDDLYEAVDAAADRLRTLPESRLRRGAAAEGLALARELTNRAQRLETPFGGQRRLPEVGIYAVGDQVAVAGYDLARAVTDAGDDDPAAGRALAEALDLLSHHR